MPFLQGPFFFERSLMNLEKMNAADVFAITPADADLAKSVFAIYVTTGGTLVLTVPGSSSVRTITVPSNFMLNCQARRVASASTASGLIGFSY